MNKMSIGQVAKKAGIGIETIRFYERKGLICEPRRKESGYREYGNEVIDRLTFIQAAKGLGFTLTEIGELLSMEIRPGTTSGDIKQVAQAKLDDIEEKLRMLKRMRRTLKELITQCSGHGPVDHCPILQSIKHK